MESRPYQIKYAPVTDASVFNQLRFISSFDHTDQMVDVYAPADSGSEELPLVLAPHPITWKAEEDYFGGPEYLYKAFHCGYYGLADKYRVIIALPHGHHRHEENCSLGYAGQIEDLAQMPEILKSNGYHIDRKRIYIMGNSMGGQEALVTAGKYPELIAACVASNPVVDLAAWYEDLYATWDPEIKKFKTWEIISNEVGGTPSECPEKYAERSAFAYIDALKTVPTLIMWSDQDGIVPNQFSKHAYKLYRTIKENDPKAPVAEFNHTICHGMSGDFSEIGRELHEWSDCELYIQWCLRWKKP